MSVARKATNVTLDSSLITEAKAHGINISRAAESGLRAAVKAARTRDWQRDNAKAIASTNDWVTQNGLPLAKHRPF
ncbi:MAG: type II toxin-antitoxin system CcdA family antitoxin [Pseudomonadota bacterium]